jgi:hypothetical protein
MVEGNEREEPEEVKRGERCDEGMTDSERRTSTNLLAMLNSKPALCRNVRNHHRRVFRHTFHRYSRATPNSSPARQPVSQDRSRRCPQPSLPCRRGLLVQKRLLEEARKVALRLMLALQCMKGTDRGVHAIDFHLSDERGVILRIERHPMRLSVSTRASCTTVARKSTRSTFV